MGVPGGVGAEACSCADRERFKTTVETISDKDQQMNEALAKMTHAMTQDEYRYVAAALDLSYEEAETLRKSEVRTPSEEHALRRFHLTRLYGADAAAVTPEFVRVYGSARVQNIYRNLSAMPRWRDDEASL